LVALSPIFGHRGNIHSRASHRTRSFIRCGALPKAQHEQPKWQTATHFLLMAAEGRLPVMFAHIALLKALNAGTPQVPAPRKKATKKYRLVR
jgi:hypothetical protein